MPFEISTVSEDFEFVFRDPAQDRQFIFTLKPSTWADRSHASLRISYFLAQRMGRGGFTYPMGHLDTNEFAVKIANIKQLAQTAESKEEAGIELDLEKTGMNGFAIKLRFPRSINALSSAVMQGLAELFELADLPPEGSEELLSLLQKNNASPSHMDQLLARNDFAGCEQLIHQGHCGYPAHQWFVVGGKLRAAGQTDAALRAYLQSHQDGSQRKADCNPYPFIDKAKYAGMRALILDLLVKAKKVDDNLLKLLEYYFPEYLYQFDYRIFFDIAEILQAKGLYQKSAYFYKKQADKKYFNGNSPNATEYALARLLHLYCHDQLSKEMKDSFEPLVLEILEKHKLTQAECKSLLFDRLDLSDDSPLKPDDLNQKMKDLAADLFGNPLYMQRFAGLEMFERFKGPRHLQQESASRVVDLLTSASKLEDRELDLDRGRLMEALAMAIQRKDLDYFNLNLQLYIRCSGVSVQDAKRVKPMTALPKSLPDFLVGIQLMLEPFLQFQKEIKKTTPVLTSNSSRFVYEGEAKSGERGSEELDTEKLNLLPGLNKSKVDG